MTEIDWHSIDANKFERMVGVLLSRLHAEVMRIDGSGGDFGRDATFDLPDGPHVFEFKSFTGRLAGSRRKQVKSSLAKAANHNPSRWTLIVPVQPTTGELDWFKSLQCEFEFPLVWRGLDWLNDQMAAMPDVRRYFLGDGFEAAMKLMRELNAEQAALENGAQDAVDRVNAVMAQLNDVDPHYRFDISTSGGQVSQVAVWPKYEGAERDSPISVNCQFVFDDTGEVPEQMRALRESLDFGRTLAGDAIEIGEANLGEVTITGPGGLADEVAKPVKMILTPLINRDWSQAGRLVLLDGDRRTLASLAVTLSERTGGKRGGTVTIRDAAGIFELLLVTDFEAKFHRFKFHFSIPDEVLPQAVVPSILFMSQMPHARCLLLAGIAEAPDGAEFPIPEGKVEQSVAPYLVRFVRNLVAIQQATSNFFPMRVGEIDTQMCKDVEMISNLVQHHRDEGTWKSQDIVIEPDGREGMLKHIEEDTPFSILQRSQEPIRLEIFDNVVELGLTQMWMPSAKLADPQATHDAIMAAGDGEEISATLVPATSDVAVLSMASLDQHSWPE